jgi:hypothetical protein
MATITIKKTKLGKRLVLLEKQYELIPDLWEEVMSYFNEAIEERLNKLGIPTLHDIFKAVYNMRITNITNSRISIEKRRTLLMGRLMKYHHRENSLVKYIPKKPEPKKKDWSGHHVGLLVRWRDKWSSSYTYGRIVEVKKGSVTAAWHHVRDTDIMPVFADDVVVRVGDVAEYNGNVKTTRFLYPFSQFNRKNDEENNDGLWDERRPFA